MKVLHSTKRESRIGRWAPALFYSAQIVTWLILGAAAGAWDLVPLAVLPLPVLFLYAARTGRGANSS